MADISDPLARLPPEILEALTPEQRAAVWEAARPGTWRRHPVNLRLSLPILGIRLFLTVVGGAEHRTNRRRRRDRRIHPLVTFPNVVFLLCMLALSIVIGLVALAAWDEILVFVRSLAPSAGGPLPPRMH